jgi:FkbM family methyltransferase
VFEPRKLYSIYRCVTAASPWYACYLSKEFSFRTEVFGLVYEGRYGVGDIVDEMVLTQGAYETHILYFLRDTLASLNPRSGVFLDVGANSGQHSMFMARYAKTVHAFEPFPPVLARFRRMLEINKIANVVVHPVGLGREFARLRFNDLDLSFSTADNEKTKPRMELAIEPGDTALERAGVTRIDLVKMDIEGFEQQALAGLAQTLERDRPVIVFELTLDPARPELFSSLADLRAVFPKDYDFLVFNRWDFYTGFYELVDLQSFVRFDGKHTYNAVAYPREKQSALALKSAVPRPTSLR